MRQNYYVTQLFDPGILHYVYGQPLMIDVMLVTICKNELINYFGNGAIWLC